MANTTEIPLDDVTPVGAAPPVDQDEMSLALDYSKLMKARGISDADTEKFLGAVAGAKPPTQEIPLDAVKPVQDFSNVESGSNTKVPPQSYLGQANEALSKLVGPGVNLEDIPLGPMPNLRNFANMGKDIANVGGEIASYVKNYGPEHETVEPGPVTPEQAKAAKMMGVPTFNIGEGGFFGKTNAAGELELHHPPVLKMSPQEIQDLNDRTLTQMGLNAKEERDRAAAFTEKPLAEGGDPIANITVHNAIGNWIQDMLNPNMAASKQYAAIQQTVAAQKILKTPFMYSEEEVAAAQALIDHYKDTVGKGVVENTKALLDEIKEDPGGKLAQIAAALEADPELLGLGKARIGTLLNEAKIASLSADLTKAQKSAELARRIGGLDKSGMDALAEGRAAHLAQEEGKVADLSQELKKTKRAETLGNMASEPLVGGAANVALDTQAQTTDKGFVTEGSKATPFAQGAALGAVAAAGEGLRLIPKKGEVPLDKVTPAEGPKGGPPGGPAAKKPGEPLPPDTPINKGNRVPLAAGVDASGKVVHMDENMPNELTLKDRNGVDVTIPVTKMVAWHERVEFPLMHLTGPMEHAGLMELLRRVQGEGSIPKTVIAKLKKGISLTYEEAHDIATMAENQRVRALYNVHPDVYQKALEPYIKKAEKPTDTPTPPNLDTKPYEETGGEVGATPEERATLAEGIWGPKAQGGKLAPGNKLPADLAKAAPRYSYGPKQFMLQFESDVDKAAYIAAGKVKSKRDADYVSFARSAGNFDSPAEVVSHGQKVRAAIKKMAKDAAPGLLKIGAITGAGAVAGAILNPDDPGKGAREGMFLPILSRMFHRGEEAEARIFKGNLEGAIKSYSAVDKVPPKELLDAHAKVTEKINQLEKETKRILAEQWDEAVAMGREKPSSRKAKKTSEETEAEARARLTPRASDELANEQAHIMLAENGNQQSIKALYDHYMPRLIRTMDKFMRKAGPRLGLQGEDIAQRAFYKAIMSLPDFKQGSSFYTYLFAIGKNTAIDVVREMKQEIETESIHKPGGGEGKPGALTGQVGFGGEDTGSDPIKANMQGALSHVDTPEQRAASSQISKFVQDTIKTLPKNLADVLYAREIEGLTDVETARKLDMNVNTVRSNNLRGKQALRVAVLSKDIGEAFTKASGPNKQGGFIDPELLKRLAKFAILAGGGGALGANYFDPQHPYKAVVQGAALALMAGQIKWGNVYKAFRDGMHHDKDTPFAEYVNQYDHDLTRGDRTLAVARNAVDGLVKTKESRERIAQHLDGNTSVQLTPEEQRAATVARDVYTNAKRDAVQSGVTRNFLEGFIARAWKEGPEREQLLKDVAAAFAKKPGQPPLTTGQLSALVDKFTSLSQGKARGLEPMAEDINHLMGAYQDSITRALANKNLVDSLRATRPDPTLRSTYIMPAGKAPQSYVAINNSQLSRYRVHPSLAPSLEYIYHVHGGGAGALAIESLNTAVKRVNVDLSLFHAKSLLDAHLGAMDFGNPWRGFVDAAQAMAGKSKGHEAYLHGGIGDDIDHLIRALKITPRKGNIPVEDVTSGFYEGLKTLQNAMDEAIPQLGKQTAGRVIQVSKALDHFLWENLHSGLKLTIAMNALERLRRSYAKEVAKNPMAHVPSTAELADMAASFTNDTFGGVNWRRMADDARTKWGREIALSLGNPTGRRISQVMMFAPDWTYSTVRSFVKAIGGGSGLGGLLNPKTVADLHRLYWIRSAFIYATLYNGINFAMSGHMIWENKRNGKPEPFLVDLGNGEWAQANKHAMEVPNLIADAVERKGIPSKWLLGKMGNIPSEVGAQMLGKEYLNPDYMPPMQESRAAHALKRVLPFSVQSYLNQGAKEAISSALGVPIYGMTNEARADKKEKQKEARKEAAPAKREAKKQKRLESLLGGQ